jgi:ubiquitin C-terminal hydrolase
MSCTQFVEYISKKKIADYAASATATNSAGAQLAGGAQLAASSQLAGTFCAFMQDKASNMDLYHQYIKSLNAVGKPLTQLRELVSNQQCVGETLTYFLEIFEHDSDVIRLFEHRYAHDLICLECNHRSRTVTTNIMFEISPTTDVRKDLYECVDVVENYKCEKCGSTKNKPKHSRLTMAPEILVIIVKNYMWGQFGGMKRSQVTDFPEFIEFSPLKYRAVAYIDHHGHLERGHYIATCLRDNCTWNTLNDIFVNPSTFAPNANTYMVFYSYMH